jgi:hypothetical protein
MSSGRSMSRAVVESPLNGKIKHALGGVSAASSCRDTSGDTPWASASIDPGALSAADGDMVVPTMGLGVKNARRSHVENGDVTGDAANTTKTHAQTVLIIEKERRLVRRDSKRDARAAVRSARRCASPFS